MWLLVVVGGVSSRTPLSWCLSLVCEQATGAVCLARITYAYGPGLLLVDGRLFSGGPETAGAHGHLPPRLELGREPVVGLAERFLHVHVASQAFLEVESVGEILQRGTKFVIPERVGLG
jgi:hypothetical protein